MAASSSMASTRRFTAPSVRSNARQVSAIGIVRQSAGFAPAAGRRCVAQAARRQPGTLPEEPREMPKWMDPNYNGMLPQEKWMDPNYNKWSDPEFLRRQAEVPDNLANASNSIAWWQNRQADVQARLNEQRAAAGQADKVGSENGKSSGNGRGKKAGCKLKVF